jgi:polyketide biosynthesis acyl carrier protein
MTGDEVFDVVRRNILEVLPELRPELITEDATMRELGANSLDRTDVVIGSQDDLGITVPATALAGATDIGGLVSILRAHVHEHA